MIFVIWHLYFLPQNLYMYMINAYSGNYDSVQLLYIVINISVEVYRKSSL